MRPRQRMHAGGSGFARGAGRILAALVGLVLLWYGAMLALLAGGVSPSTVNSLSGYRGAFDVLAGLAPGDISGTARIVVAVVGVVVLVTFLLLAKAGLPRPHLARTDVELERSPLGVTTVAARAVERVVETAALTHDGVTGARGRYDDGAVVLDIATSDETRMAETLRSVREDAARQLQAHGLHSNHIDVTITAYDRPKGRTLR